MRRPIIERSGHKALAEQRSNTPRRPSAVRIAGIEACKEFRGNHDAIALAGIARKIVADDPLGVAEGVWVACVDCIGKRLEGGEEFGRVEAAEDIRKPALPLLYFRGRYLRIERAESEELLGKPEKMLSLPDGGGWLIKGVQV